MKKTARIAFVAVAAATMVGVGACSVKPVPVNPSDIPVQVWYKAAGDELEKDNYVIFRFDSEYGDTRLLQDQPGAPTDAPYSSNFFDYSTQNPKGLPREAIVNCVEQRKGTPLTCKVTQEIKNSVYGP